MFHLWHFFQWFIVQTRRQPTRWVPARLSLNADVSLEEISSSLRQTLSSILLPLSYTFYPQTQNCRSTFPGAIRPWADLVAWYRWLDVTQKRGQPFAGGADIWLREEIVTRPWQSHIVLVSLVFSTALVSGKESGRGRKKIGFVGAQRENLPHKLIRQRPDWQMKHHWGVKKKLQSCKNLAQKLKIGHREVEHFYFTLLKRESPCSPSSHKHRGIKDAQAITEAPSCLIEVMDAAQ